jgi:hypothetical protein
MPARQDSMTPTRLRNALRSMRWPPRTLATALSVKEELVDAWLDGTRRIPGHVAVWLETLAAVHETHPKPAHLHDQQPSRAAEPRVVFARKPSRRW